MSLSEQLLDFSYPVVLKAEYGSGGRNVIVCFDFKDISDAYSMLRRNSLNGRLIIQEYISGIPAMCECVVHQGNLLECVFSLKIETYPKDTGPCSVARFTESIEAVDSMKALVFKLGFNGFCHGDFIYQPQTGKVFFLEFNPRPSPMTALGYLNNKDLCKAYATLWGVPHKVAYSKLEQNKTTRTIAFFPNEWQRNPNSSYILNEFHDVPWDDPILLKALVNDIVRD